MIGRQVLARRDSDVETGVVSESGSLSGQAALASLFATAFNGYPVCDWLLEPVEDPDRSRSFLFSSLLKAILTDRVRVEHVSHHAAAALWIGSEDLPLFTRQAGRAYLRSYRQELGPLAARRLLELDLATARHHPRSAYDYLFLVGVDPKYQRHGLGRRLLRAGIERANELGRDLLLDTSSKTNLDFYTSLGFEILATYVAAPNAPTTWTMRKSPSHAN
jgi:GNAT superfamily N-acetyltransferase